MSCYETLELVFEASTDPPNPFEEYLLRLRVIAPSGKVREVDGFFDGDGRGGQSGRIWKARLVPDEPGLWSWRAIPGARPEPAFTGLQGVFHSAERSRMGGLEPVGRHFRVRGGPYLFLVGNFLDRGALPSHLYFGDTVTTSERERLLQRQRELHSANKLSIYLANVGDYRRERQGVTVTPWLGEASEPDRSRLDLERWHLYDALMQRLDREGFLAELWIFADDSSFGELSMAERKLLLRYAMARLSSFRNSLFVVALEWQEDWEREEVDEAGTLMASRNPWGRPLSVHGLSRADWPFTTAEWPSFIATQAGNDAQPAEVYRYATRFWKEAGLPHVGEEFGWLGRSLQPAGWRGLARMWARRLLLGRGWVRDDEARLRANAWANLCAGAAGGGTGAGLAQMQTFLGSSRAPLERMVPSSYRVSGGGSVRFVRAEIGSHYLVYSLRGGFRVTLRGDSLSARWFDPRQGRWATREMAVKAGIRRFEPPRSVDGDWVLWISNGRGLGAGLTRLPGGAGISESIHVTGSAAGPRPGRRRAPQAVTLGRATEPEEGSKG